MREQRRKILVIGATSSIAEHCARLWAARNDVDFVLVGRDGGKMALIAEDLRVRDPQGTVSVLTADFADPASIKAVIDGQAPFDLALIAHGVLPDQASCQNDPAANAAALGINAVSPVLFAEAIAGLMEKRGCGTLAVIGSVAGDRGRKSNYVYGAAKGLVARYVQGLQHRLAGSGVTVVLVKPGPTDTPMTARLKQQGVALAAVEDVARTIVRGIDAGRSTVYAPGRWRIIMLIVRHLPAVIFNRLDI